MFWRSLCQLRIIISSLYQNSKTCYGGVKINFCARDKVTETNLFSMEFIHVILNLLSYKKGFSTFDAMNLLYLIKHDD